MKTTGYPWKNLPLPFDFKTTETITVQRVVRSSLVFCYDLLHVWNCDGRLSGNCSALVLRKYEVTPHGRLLFGNWCSCAFDTRHFENNDSLKPRTGGLLVSRDMEEARKASTEVNAVGPTCCLFSCNQSVVPSFLHRGNPARS